MSQEPRFYGHTQSGQAVYEYTLNSPSGVTLRALNYGGVITALEIPMPSGERENVVLSLENLEAYESNPNFVGSLIGRYGGRVTTPVTIGGKIYHLSANDRGNCLHGGFEGFDKKIWQAQVSKEGDAEVLHLKYMSREGEEGFPGNLMVHISYQLWKDGHVQIIYRAISDQDTIVGMTQHSYFNLNPAQLDNLDHQLQIEADFLQKTGENQTPLDELVSLENHDITKEEGTSVIAMNRWIKETFEDDMGLDHAFHLKKVQTASPMLPVSSVKLWNPANKLRLTIRTDYPAVVVYAGGWLDQAVPLKDKRCARPFGGLCLEAQEIPNGPNLQNFGLSILKNGDFYHRTCTWTFDFID
jgi:aldose 1-epimerase